MSQVFRRGISIVIAALAVIAAAVSAQNIAPTAPAPHGSAGGFTGKVVETMDASSYTYVLVDNGTQKQWAAAPQFKVAVGDTVVVPAGVPMRDFHSATLNRTFDVVYFVANVEVVGARTARDQIAAAHGSGHGGGGPTSAVDLKHIPKAAGGYTVAELYADKAKLAGKPIAVRGRVVKFTPDVMGKNWIHLQDGSGAAGSNDLTVSTDATAKIGDTVLVRGTLGTDKDLGFGYHYDVLIEDATVAVE